MFLTLCMAVLSMTLVQAQERTYSGVVKGLSLIHILESKSRREIEVLITERCAETADEIRSHIAELLAGCQRIVRCVDRIAFLEMCIRDSP